MSAQPSRPSTESPSSLRAALLSPPTPEPVQQVAATPVLPQGSDAHEASLLPTAPELLAASPNLQRLCESYHTTRRRMIERGRRQRLGIAALVCGLGVGAVFLARQGSLPAEMVNLLVVSVAAASAAGLVVLGWLWVRDERKLRHAQGERLLRALQFNCSLPEDSLRAFRRLVAPTSAFFDVYNAWKLQHPDRRSALAILLSGFSGKSRSAASA
jgi:Na+/proline symporter